MSASGESKMDAIILKFIEECDASGEIGGEIKKRGVADIYDFLQEKKLLPQFEVKAQKADQESERIRAAGNAAYKMKDFKDALLNYTSAICCAKLEGEPLALAYANRSAVHYELQAYDDVIKDINHALDSSNYPEDMKHKLFERRAKSYLALSQYQSALEDFKKVVSYLTNELARETDISKPVNSDQEKVTSDVINGTLKVEKGISPPTNSDLVMEKIISHYTKGDLDQGKIISLLTNGKADREKVLRLQPLVELIARCVGKPNLPRTKSAEPKVSHKPSKNGKSSFPAMEIAISPEMGKHIVATINISPGDILAVEKPYVSVLTPEFYYSFCDNCKIRCLASIPCANCNNVVFCSENCRRQGWDSHHSVECDLLPTVIALGCKVNVLIGIRGLLKATRCGKDLQRFVDEQVHESKAHRQKSKEKMYPKTSKFSHDFHSVHNLVTHEKDRSEVQMLSVMATVSCIVHIMKGATRFFGSSSSQTSSLGLNHIVAANLISRYFMMAGCNAFEIRESNLTPSGEFTDHEPRIIGGALYPTLCLLNHSCDPDVTAYMSTEETRVLYAIKPVRRGEQIFISYGPEYIHHGLPARQKELKSKYFFTCTCPACLNNWPTADNLPEYPTFVSHRVESTQGPRIFDTCKKLPEIVLAADQGSISQEQMQVAAQFLSLYHKYVIRPWKYYFAAQSVIRQYFNCIGQQKIIKMPEELG